MIYIHAFAEQGNNYDNDDEQQGSGHPRSIGRGIPPFICTAPSPFLRKFQMVLIWGLNQNWKFMEALCSFPKLPTDSSELDDFFGYDCRGGKFLGACYKRPHINIICGIHHTPCSVLNSFCAWLMIPVVKVQVYLTTQASTINGLCP